MTTEETQLDWVPLKFREWIIGTMELTADAELALFRLCLKGYEKSRPQIIAPDPRLAHWCKLTPERFAVAIEELIELGKVERIESGVFVPSVDKHLSAAVGKLQSHQRGAAIARRRKELRAESKSDADIASIIAAEFPDQKPRKAPARKAVPPPFDSPVERATAERDEEQIALDAYNEVAREHGLPEVKKWTRQRRVALRLRLKENGGLPGWMAALALIPKSRFLLGGKDGSGWRASFDFLLHPSSFTKLIEGTYTDKASAPKESAARTAFKGMIQP